MNTLRITPATANDIPTLLDFMEQFSGQGCHTIHNNMDGRTRQMQSLRCPRSQRCCLTFNRNLLMMLCTREDNNH